MRSSLSDLSVIAGEKTDDVTKTKTGSDPAAGAAVLPPPIPKTARVIYKVATLTFPFIWPSSEVIVDEIKVSYIWRYPLWIEVVRTFLLTDVKDVFAETGLLFGTVSVVAGEFKEDPAVVIGNKLASESNGGPFVVPYLWPHEAQRLRRVILGLIVLHKQKVDTSLLGVDEVLSRAQVLGEAKHEIGWK